MLVILILPCSLFEVSKIAFELTMNNILLVLNTLVLKDLIQRIANVLKR